LSTIAWFEACIHVTDFGGPTSISSKLWLQHTLAENYMGRFKGIIGPKLRGRKIESQKVEAMIGCAILNRMAALGTPTTLTANG
jgi:lysozyme family protein